MLAAGGKRIAVLVGIIVLALIVVALATALVVQWRRGRRDRELRR